MFDSSGSGRCCPRLISSISRYSRIRGIWITVGMLLMFCLGIWVGRKAPFGKIADYVRSYTDFTRSDVTRQLTRGITHRQICENGVLTNILTVAPTAAEVRPYRALGAGIGTESVASLARRENAFAAINGGFFETVGTFRGESVGALKIDGEWVSEPEQGRAAIGFRTTHGKIETAIDRITLQQTLVLPSGETLQIDGINRSRGENECIRYRPGFHSVTLTTPDGVEAVVRNHVVISIQKDVGSTAIPIDGYILSASGQKGDFLLAHLREGDPLEVRETRHSAQDNWAGFTHIIGGGPLLLQAGRPVPPRTYAAEGFDPAFHNFWHPRTAIGKKADGTLLFVTITAADRDVRRGVTLPELAARLSAWGATDALNLDGGHSSTLVIQNVIVSVRESRKKAGSVKETGNRRIRPLPPQEGRAIADALLIFLRAER